MWFVALGLLKGQTRGAGFLEAAQEKTRKLRNTTLIVPPPGPAGL